MTHAGAPRQPRRGAAQPVARESAGGGRTASERAISRPPCAAAVNGRARALTRERARGQRARRRLRRATSSRSPGYLLNASAHASASAGSRQSRSALCQAIAQHASRTVDAGPTATDQRRVVHPLKASRPYSVACAAVTVKPVLILSWNLFHGRSLPPTRHALLRQFAAQLAEWRWDVALLQEAPPWWLAELARAAGAERRRALTSRNALPALRRALAERDPELIKSNGGGCNAILARRPIAEHATLRLRTWPERRVAQLARLRDGTCVVNFHASTRAALAEHELRRLWQRALDWAGGDPLILGGDLNLRAPRAPDAAAHVARCHVDHIFVRGLAPVGQAQALHRRVALDGRSVELSDHAPLRVRVGDVGFPAPSSEGGD
jgi:endonuclease/exonuclease/phosphatase family metal-dependent hydrolase